jgi:tyrosine-protein kinase Etk/Wzc
MVLKSRVDLQQQLLTLEQDKQSKIRLFKKDHPSIRTIEQQEEKIYQELARIGVSAKNLPLTQQEVIKLQEAVNLNSTLYVNMLNNIQQLRVARAGEIGNVRIVDHASYEKIPVKPHRVLIFAGFLLGSLVLGVLFVFFLRMIRGVCSASEIEKETGISVYARIPESKEKKFFRKHKHESQLSDETRIEEVSQDPTSEALRTLRTALEFSFADGKLKVLAITGLLPDVGKSFVSENLAMLFADMNKKVLLIDADLRRGHISRRDKKGLTDVLYGKSSFEEVIEKNKNSSLSIVGAGSIQTNPSEILGSELFAQIIRRQRADYDLIIIDTPPVLLVTDALLVCKQSDFVLMVVRYGAHELESIKEGLQMLDLSGIRHKAFVLNRCEYEGDTYSYACNYKSQN